MQIIDRTTGVGGGLEDCSFVVPQQLQPFADIGSMVLADIGSDVEIGREKRRSEFRDIS